RRGGGPAAPTRLRWPPPEAAGLSAFLHRSRGPNGNSATSSPADGRRRHRRERSPGSALTARMNRASRNVAAASTHHPHPAPSAIAAPSTAGAAAESSPLLIP